MKRPLRLKDRLTKAQLEKRKWKIYRRNTSFSRLHRQRVAPTVISVSSLGIFTRILGGK